MQKSNEFRKCVQQQTIKKNEISYRQYWLYIYNIYNLLVNYISLFFPNISF